MHSTDLVSLLAALAVCYRPIPTVSLVTGSHTCYHSWDFSTSHTSYLETVQEQGLLSTFSEMVSNLSAFSSHYLQLYDSNISQIKIPCASKHPGAYPGYELYPECLSPAPSLQSPRWPSSLTFSYKPGHGPFAGPLCKFTSASIPGLLLCQKYLHFSHLSKLHQGFFADTEGLYILMGYSVTFLF
jgi:hypothetical protein